MTRFPFNPAHTFVEGDRVLYASNFGRGPLLTGTVTHVDNEYGRRVYDVKIDNATHAAAAIRWGYEEQFEPLLGEAVLA